MSARLLGCSLLAVGLAQGQIASSAYRVLGQPDLHQQGINVVQGVSLSFPTGIALDSRGGQLHIYIADSGNSRVLAWHDVASYQIGQAPDIVLGQPAPYYSNPLGTGTKGLNHPAGLAVDSTTGNLYVADTSDNRVLRFPSPFANSGSVQPDAVYGQPDFTTFTANSSGVSASSLNGPTATAFDSAGNLWVADTGNNRVLRFAASTLNNVVPPSADTVVGQADFASDSSNRGGVVSGAGLNTPFGLAFDSQSNLYVSDFNNTRVLKFAAPLGPSAQGPTAATVFGEPDFVSHGVSGTASASTMDGPVGIAVDSKGNLYVAVPKDNRVMVFPPAGGAAVSVFGQSDFVTTAPNAGVFPQASTNTLYDPWDVVVDANGNVYISDAENNRVLSFPPSARSAGQVWGQSDFMSCGVNEIKPTSLYSPSKMAIDYSQSPFALYVSDTGNNRVLIWQDAAHFRNGDPADLVIGQPSLVTGFPNIDTQSSVNPSSTSLSGPHGLAVDAVGNLWVADTGNNRVLHYPRPVAQSGRITPDVVIGQSSFTSSASGASSNSFNTPVGLALGPNGDLFVSDTGNNRVLEFQAGPGTNAAAIRVYGQPSFNSSVSPGTPSAQTLNAPTGVFVDSGSNLYVADSGSNRVLIIPDTQVAATSGTPAAYVIGQASFNAISGGGGTPLKLPTDVGVDSVGNIYIADQNNNRVLIFPSLIFLPVAGGTAQSVVGQQSLSGTAVNWDSTDGLATADGLAAPFGLLLDRRDTVYVADFSNNRVVHFLKPATVVNAADYLQGAPVGQGSLAAFMGSGLADSTSPVSGSAPWPTSLVDRQIAVSYTILSPLSAVSPTQINFQVPGGSPVGSDPVAVQLADTGELIAGGTMLVAAVSPGLFTVTQNGTGQAAALNQDGVTLNGSSNPAPTGTVISLFGTGQGQVSPAVADGAAAPASPPAVTVAVPTTDATTCLATQPSICVAIGDVFGVVQFSGLAPNYVGLWQINVQIPSNAPTGNAVPVRVVIDGTGSNTVTVAIN
jgi:uncharacterized protein (TIGR03437 family)